MEVVAFRRKVSVVLVAVAAGLLFASASRPSGGRVDTGHGLWIAVPPGAHLSYRAFTPCSDPVERFSLISGGQVLTLQERLDPVAAELSSRPTHFRVSGAASPLECCSISGRSGWVIQFGDHGRAFYAYVYPGHSSPSRLLRALDSLRVRR
jgi:hypothetical protein